MDKRILEKLTHKQIQSIAYRLMTRGNGNLLNSHYKFARTHEGQVVLNSFGKEKVAKVETSFFNLILYKKHKFPISAIKDIYTFRRKNEIAKEHGVNRRTLYRWEQAFIQEFKQEII